MVLVKKRAIYSFFGADCKIAGFVVLLHAQEPPEVVHPKGRH
jgi:hypothetical protein